MVELKLKTGQVKTIPQPNSTRKCNLISNKRCPNQEAPNSPSRHRTRTLCPSKGTMCPFSTRMKHWEEPSRIGLAISSTSTCGSLSTKHPNVTSTRHTLTTVWRKPNDKKPKSLPAVIQYETLIMHGTHIVNMSSKLTHTSWFDRTHQSITNTPNRSTWIASCSSYMMWYSLSN